jgi:hypothetical protein
MRDRIAAHQHRAQPASDEEGDGLRHWSGDAGDTLIGLDLDEISFDIEATRDLLTTFKVLAAAIFRIDIDRPHQALLPKRTGCGHGAAELAQANSSDFHGFDAFGCL